MAGALDYIFGSTPPPSVNSTVASTNGLPDWYQEYLRGIGGKATEIAGNAQESPLPEQSVAGLTPDQTQALQQVRDNQGAWRPLTDQAATTAQQITPQVQNYVGQAQNAVAGPSANFTDNYQQYMSPYTQSVVDNIARLGNRNYNENIAPGVNASMISSGQYGSERNADVLARAGRDVQADISGQQSQALQSGYSTAGTLFNADANRQQQQQQMQGSAALQGAGAVSSALQGQAGQLGALGQSYSALGLGDAQSLQAAGQQQQQLNQAGLDTAYTNAQAARTDPWTQLNNVNSAVRGLQLPSTQVGTTNAPLASASFGTGTIGALGQAYGATRSGTAAVK